MSSDYRGGMVSSVHAHASAHLQAMSSRRLKRLEQTQEIKVRTHYRRRKAVTRSGVLVGFALAMIVYPVMGTIAPYAVAVENIPGVTIGELPSTAHAILGDGPQLNQVELPVPTVDEHAMAILISANYMDYSVSHHLPDCDPTVPWYGTNGNLNDESLCALWDGKVLLRADAAVAIAELNQRFKLQFGRDMCIYQGYRTYAEQVGIRSRRGGLAATPGRSVHGWGLAIDLCGGDDRGDTKQWLEDNGPAWGWVNPDWAKSRKWEPWHWEYLPGTDEIGFYGAGYWESDAGQELRSEDYREPDPVVTDPAPSPAPAPVVE